MSRTTSSALPVLGVMAVLVTAPALAGERDRPAPAASATTKSGKDFNWTGGYLGVTVGAASGGGRVREGGKASDADRYPPARTRVRP